jgi:hypothetical protein
VSVEALHPLDAQCIACPAIITHSDSPVRWEVLMPAGLVELAIEDHERWDTLARSVDTPHRHYPLTRAWLNDSCSTHNVRASDYF